MEIDQNTHREAFEKYASKIIDLDSVEKVILFGSVARNSHGINSDVDVFVKVEDMSEADEIEEAAFETAADEGVSITPIIKQYEDESSLMKDIKQEGVEYVRG